MDVQSGEELHNLDNLNDFSYKIPISNIPAHGARVLEFQISIPFHSHYITIHNEANSKVIGTIVVVAFAVIVAVILGTMLYQERTRFKDKSRGAHVQLETNNNETIDD